ncbi:hypothetical protein, partial [Flagellimonas amphidinii]
NDRFRANFHFLLEPFVHGALRSKNVIVAPACRATLSLFRFPARAGKTPYQYQYQGIALSCSVGKTKDFKNLGRWVLGKMQHYWGKNGNLQKRKREPKMTPYVFVKGVGQTLKT